MIEDIIIEESCGNVFTDLGYPNAEEALAKSRLAQCITEIIKEQNLTQVQAAAILGIDQPKISKLIRGQLREFSTDRLFRFLNALNQDVEIVITSKPESRPKAILTVISR
ncbi:helix-turn-helix domain-containing protein [Aphanothece sacrum]|uniref:XRE family transcriptional regulator n=1 Tax=Aphanothece sacrum FPU1 TaxID=1920663 RepID=A0A401IHT5_APHSA|nr:helix-turn-helix transcriptional regulator [Aphanothece sacrum]GBF80760.1 XRE family transcriptional regulator [Aphanothece sacrum FPU1]GBF83255.1 XRE family transcriptional regulator [Aphanothece sacrum FPU3]